MTGIAVRLTEPMSIDAETWRLDGRAMGGRRVRAALAVLLLERGRAVPREQLAAVLWPDGLPSTWQPSLREVVSKVRAIVDHPDRPLGTLVHEAGCYRVDLREPVDVDVERAAADQRRAEELVARDADGAVALAEAAIEIAGRPLLPSEAGDWAEARRAALHDLRLAALETLAAAHRARGAHRDAVAAAEQALALEPLRERAHQLRIGALAAAGDRVRAVELHASFRQRLQDEFGVLPSAETRDVYTAIIADAPAPALAVTTADTLPLPRGLRTDQSPPYVGSAAARATMRAAWERVRAGERRIVLVSGEAGLGKSRLAAEAAEAAHAEGAWVLHVVCDQGDSGGFAALAHGLRGLVSHLPEDVLRRHVAAHGPALARLVPALAARLPDLAGPSQLDPRNERAGLLASVAGLVVDVAARRPVVLVVDDLHWADRSTLAAVGHLVAVTGDAPLLLVGTYRPAEVAGTDGLVALLAACDRQPDVDRPALAPLALEDVGTLVAPDGPGAALAARLHAEAAGNPFFVVQMLRALVDAGAAHRRDDGRYVIEENQADLTPSEDVRGIVVRRVQPLGPETAELLTLAAACGAEFDLELLEGVTGEPPEALARGLQAATRADLVTPVDGAPGRYRFVHPLVASSLADALSAPRRAALSRQIAEALEALADAGRRVHPAEIARHHVAALPSPDGAPAREFALRAGRRALDELAPDEALRWFLTASGLLGADATPAQRIDVLIGLGEAQQRTGGTSWRETLLQAARLALEVDDPDRLAEAVLANARVWYIALGQTDHERIALLEATTQRLPATDPRRARTLALLAAERVFDGDVAARGALCDEALTLARRSEDPMALPQVLALRATATWVPWTLQERRAEAEELEALAAARQDPTLRFWACMWNVVQCGQRNDREGLERALDQQRALADSHPRLEVIHIIQEGCWKLAQGDLESAERLANEGLARGTALGEVEVQGYYPALMMGIRAAQDRLAEMVTPLTIASTTLLDTPMVRALLALGRVRSGDVEGAHGMLAAEAATFTSPRAEPTMLATLCTWAEVAVSLGATGPAELLLAGIDPYRDQHVLLVTSSYGSAGRHAARLHALLGHEAEADERYAAAIGDLDRFGAVGFAAAARAEQAELLLDRDRGRARSLADHALRAVSPTVFPVVVSRAQAVLDAA